MLLILLGNLKTVEMLKSISDYESLRIDRET